MLIIWEIDISQRLWTSNSHWLKKFRTNVYWKQWCHKNRSENMTDCTPLLWFHLVITIFTWNSTCSAYLNNGPILFLKDDASELCGQCVGAGEAVWSFIWLWNRNAENAVDKLSFSFCDKDLGFMRFPIIYCLI